MEQFQHLDSIGKFDEEFNNFMVKVNEVSSIVKKMSSTDRELQKIGDLEAKKYLGETDEKVLENIDEEDVILKIKSNRTLINKKALAHIDKDSASMSQGEAFMDEISKDADKRYRDKLVRKEKMETFKKQATLAFRRGEYEKALSLYNKAKNDLDWALRLNEDCLKSWLLLAKTHYLSKNYEEYKRAIEEAQQRNPEEEDFIKEYVENLETEEITTARDA
ncbi:hypothetical protein NQ314_007311 [Rhamnusium bicolor]|uniref:Tetratricopeptide repeat protein 12 n=1 Tax=Rhamnusium bicolor TaxID=1586634 RepID=A0AAV8YSR9_9CUCU|nr:hypothetical protein NQ314_007311 [Rhamnusium bicolor]